MRAMADDGISRARFLKTAALGVVSAALPVEALAAPKAEAASGEITDALIAAAEPLVGVDFPTGARPRVAGVVKELRSGLDELRKRPLPNAELPVLVYRPEGRQPEEGRRLDVRPRAVTQRRPSGEEDLAFLSAVELGALLRTRQVTSVELTRLFLGRLETYGRKLKAVINLTPERALRVAAEADARFARGEVRSSLQGIPTGVKDMLATKDAPTTWGAAPFGDQRFDYDAAVVERLEAAGSPLLGKLSLGSLGWNDVWFGGTTRNPWAPEEGSGGSSAGPVATVAAGLLPFAIGTEAYGSIVTPSERCRVVGLRPTFGRISRHGLMSGTWSIDKIGVIARSPEDTALVLGALAGADPRDPSSIDRPLSYAPIRDLNGTKVKVALGNILASDAQLKVYQAAQRHLRELGASLTEREFTLPPESLLTILYVEGAAAFEDFIRSAGIDELTESPWPVALRAAMYPTGVDYIQALRHRRIATRTFEEEFGDADLILAPDTAENLVLLTNLTGHPQIYLPTGQDAAGQPCGLSLIGRLYDEGRIIAIAQALQSRMQPPNLRPDLTRVLALED